MFKLIGLAKRNTSNKLRNLTQLHQRPLRVDHNPRPVALHHGPRPIYHLLVALDLRHDLLLHGQRGEGDFQVRERLPTHPWKLCAFELTQDGTIEVIASKDMSIQLRQDTAIQRSDNENVS